MLQGKERKLTGMDLLLLLLYAAGSKKKKSEPIGGMTRLQKEMFLIQKMLSDEKIEQKYRFRPYTHGPFTRDLYSDVDLLESDNKLKQEQISLRDRGIYRIFRLSDKGCQEAMNLLNRQDAKRVFEIVTRVKKEYNDMNLYDLVEYTHRIFPEYVQDHSKARKPKS